MRVAILGTRGVPPNYGGFETFAAELGVRLIEFGHDVTVYCRERGPAEWNGIHRIEVPYARGKYFETVSHTFVSAVDALRRGFDAIVLCNAANAFGLPLLRAARIPVAINVDGIERRRRKWNLLGRAIYAMGEALSVSLASAVVADAQTIADYYRAQYGVATHVIAYGADFPAEDDSDVLQRLGIRTRDYILYVSRFEPENNPLEVVRAYEALADAPPLVMLGKGLYAPELVAELHRHASERVLFPGALYGRDYRTLQRNALLYIQATEVGGTHPALIEAMASGGAVLALDTPENREVGGGAIGYFQFRGAASAGQTLSDAISEWLANPLRTDDFRLKARSRADAVYSWDRVAAEYDKLIRRML